jgi:hypothetical protein
LLLPGDPTPAAQRQQRKIGRPQTSTQPRKPGRPPRVAGELKSARILVVATPSERAAIKRRAGDKSISSYLVEGGVAGWVRNARLAMQLDRALGPIEKYFSAPAGATSEMIEKARRGCDAIRAITNNV